MVLQEKPIPEGIEPFFFLTQSPNIVLHLALADGKIIIFKILNQPNSNDSVLDRKWDAIICIGLILSLMKHSIISNIQKMKEQVFSQDKQSLIYILNYI